MTDDRLHPSGSSKCHKNCHRSFGRLRLRANRESPPPLVLALAPPSISDSDHRRGRQRTVQLEGISIPMKREGTVKKAPHRTYIYS